MSTTSVTRRPRAHAPSTMSTGSAIWLVAERETLTKFRSKSFIISTLILLLIVVGSIVWMSIAGGSTSTTPVAATGQAAAQVANVPGLEVTEVVDRDAATTLVESGDVDAAVVPDDASPAGVTIIADTQAPESLVAALSVSPTIELLDSSADSEGPMRYILSLAFGVLFMTTAITFGTAIITSVIEEKATRVVEIIISAIPARVLLAGKVIGNTVIAMAQVLLIAAGAVIGLSVTGQTALLQGLGAPIIWFAVFFLFGFIVLAAMFAAAGSLVSRQEDANPVMTPLIWITMIPYFLVIFFNGNEAVINVMSYVPIASTVSMPIRLYFGDAMWWEPIASLAITVATAAVVIILGAKIYERSLLRMGARVKLSEALRG